MALIVVFVFNLFQFFFMRQDRPKFSAQERYVPSSKTSRVFHFGVLGVQLIAGTASEAIKQKVGL